MIQKMFIFNYFLNKKIKTQKTYKDCFKYATLNCVKSKQHDQDLRLIFLPLNKITPELKKIHFLA